MADPLMSECLIYQLKPGRTTVITFERHSFLSDLDLGRALGQ